MGIHQNYTELSSRRSASPFQLQQAGLVLPSPGQKLSLVPIKFSPPQPLKTPLDKTKRPGLRTGPSRQHALGLSSTSERRFSLRQRTIPLCFGAADEMDPREAARGEALGFSCRLGCLFLQIGVPTPLAQPSFGDAHPTGWALHRPTPSCGTGRTSCIKNKYIFKKTIYIYIKIQWCRASSTPSRVHRARGKKQKKSEKEQKAAPQK